MTHRWKGGRKKDRRRDIVRGLEGRERERERERKRERGRREREREEVQWIKTKNILGPLYTNLQSENSG